MSQLRRTTQWCMQANVSFVWNFFNNAFVYEALICGGLKGSIEEHEPLAQVENKTLLSLLYGISL